ncbi:MAG: hypothetical protein PF638_05100 [Candidatus Delongbacteria bacterium]|nr:hypothetical protein [Candidatus Delongbacteria bacterium]
MQRIIGKLQTFELSFVFFNLIIISFIFHLNDIALGYLLLLIPIVFYTAIVEIKVIIYHYKKNSIRYFRHYVIATCYSVIIIVSYWLNTISIQPENYSNIISNTMTFIISIAIFNIASLLVLLQLNYNKFGSHYLVLKILKSPIVIFLTILPSSLIMLNYFFLNPNFSKSYIPTLLIISSLLSSIGLLLLFRMILGTNLLLEKLFKDIDENDFKTYRKNNIHENKIDIVLKITIDIINKNDSISSHSLFLYLARWIKNNISLINDQFDHRRTEHETKFAIFFDDIINRLSETNNSIVKLNFLISMRRLLLLDIDQENFKPYEIIYNYLFKYLYLTLRKGDDDNATEIYNVIYKRAPYILLNLSKVEISEYNTVVSSKELFNFKKIFVDPVRKIYDIGKENQNINFLKKTNLYNDLFVIGYKDEESFKKWDGKVFDIYVHTRIQMVVMHQFLLENDVSFYDIEKNYELFLHYSKYDCKNNKNGISENLNKYLADNLLSLFTYGIKKDKMKYESDLEMFWSHLFYGTIKENYLQEFKEYFTIYTRLIYHVFDYELSKDKSKNSEEKPNIRLIYDLWGGFNQFVNQD